MDAIGRQEDIVITGLSARFPQADSLAEFKEKLYAGVDFVTDDETRWPRGYLGLPECMGKIRDLSLFDAQFFNVLPKQAHLMDPQMRLLLETAYEAIVDAGYDPQTFRGRSVGVFIGCSNADSHETPNFNAEKAEGHGLIGSSRAMFANRIAYTFDFHGLSMAIDTACSSTMTALNQAMLCIRSGQCEAAIVGGSTLCLKPSMSSSFLRLGMLSPDGKCKSFDSRANGYARSETVGVLFLQRASEARRIYAKVIHTKAGCDGYKSRGITFPSSQAQERLLKAVYAEAKVDPYEVGYVEAHGSATRAGDTHELCAISNVFCRSERENRLKVGSVKTNVGHSESASGICSIAKVVLAMETGLIAGNLHFVEANPDIPSLHDGSIEVVDKVTPFPHGPVGVNSFGFGGSSVHAILEPGPGQHVDSMPRVQAELPRLVIMAGRSVESLRRTLERMQNEGPYPDPAYALLNLVGQPDKKLFPYRAFAVVPVDGSGSTVFTVGECVPLEKRAVWFVFTGMGSQWRGMARQMMQLDVFARSIHKSHEVLKQFGIDFIDVVTNGERRDQCMASVQASIAAVQVALVDTLRTVGIQPDGVLGHSVGELGCGYVDGCLTSEETVVCAYWRGRCIDMGNLPKGAMAAVGLTWEEAEQHCRNGVVPACHNSLDSVTVSGPADAVEELIGKLKDEDVFAREVDSMNVAFHSRDMLAIAPDFMKALQEIIPTPKPRSQRWISSSLPKSRWQEPKAQECSADYLVNNLVAPVLFYEAILHVPKDAIIVEVGPHCLLQPVLRRALGSGACCLGLMKRDEDNLSFFLNSLGKLHTLGVQLDLTPLYPAVSFPVPRGTPSIGHLVSWDHSQRWTVAKWSDFDGSGNFPEEVVEVNLGSNERDGYLSGHQLDGRLLFPAAGYMVLAWKFLVKRSGRHFEEVPVLLEDVIFHRATILPKNGPVRLTVHIMPSSGEFEISENGTLAASGRIRITEDRERLLDTELPGLSADKTDYEFEEDDVYRELMLRGHEHHGKFRSVLSADMKSGRGKLKWDKNWLTFIDSMLQLYEILNPRRGFRPFAKIQSCRIDPRVHADIVDEAGHKGIHAVYDRYLNTCRAGGVVIEGLKSTLAMRRSERQTPLLQEYRFVPYIDDDKVVELRETEVREYIGACNAIILDILEERKGNVTDVFELKNDSCESSEEVLNRYVKTNAENNGLLQVVVTIKEEISRSSSSLASVVEQTLKTHREVLDKDIVNTALLEEDPLRPLLEVAVENTYGSKIRILELAPQGGDFLLTPIVSRLLSLSHDLRKIEYALAHPCPNNLTLNHLPEGIFIHQWNPASALTTDLPDAEVVIAHNALGAATHLETLAEQLSKQCKEGGFVILSLRTALTSVEAFLSNISNVPIVYHKQETVISLLGGYGLQMVGLKSNNWSTLLLLRKMAVAQTETKEELVKLSNTQFEWVDKVKEKISEPESSRLGKRLWLIAEDIGISGVVGFINCLRLETGGSNIRCLFDANLSDPDMDKDAMTVNPPCKKWLERDLLMNVYRDGKWGSFRSLTMQCSTPKVTEYAFVNIETSGDLSSLQWYESRLRYADTSSINGKVLCSVYYAPLNFRDVMLATGKLPADAIPYDMVTSECLLGLEFSGRDTKGCRVMGLVPAEGMATVVAVDPHWLWEVPDAWSLEEASTVPVVYCTAYYALIVRGNMQPGESLLVHSGSGGVGQAAISIALSMGCTVFTTVGSKEKGEFLKRRFWQLEDRNIASSRDMSFQGHVLRETEGKGVNLVLNSLSEEKLQASLRCLAKNGRFLEIGKVDLSKDSSLGMSVFLKNVTFHGILLEALHESNPFTAKDKRRVRALVSEGITSGVVQPLGVNRFSWNQVEETFRCLASGKHTGKNVLVIREEETPRKTCLASTSAVEAVARTYFFEDKTYVIVGGLGGVGLELADWMVGRGCRKLVLSRRSGVQNGFQQMCIRRWQYAGAAVHIIQADVSTEKGAREIIEKSSLMGPLGGIFNLAMVLSDALLENQTSESFERVCKPKVDGTRWLDELSRKLCTELDHFVVFSSVASSRGNAGQTSYGYANSVMERICERRVSDGLPGLAIQWGPVSDVGVLYQAMAGDMDIAGCAPQRISSYMNLLDQMLNQKFPVVSCMVKANGSSNCEDKLAKTRSLLETIANIFGVKDPSSLNPMVSLGDLGMDSLMGVEVKQTLERDYDLTLSMPEIRQLTLGRLQEMDAVGSESTVPSETKSA